MQFDRVHNFIYVLTVTAKPWSIWQAFFFFFFGLMDIHSAQCDLYTIAGSMKHQESNRWHLQLYTLCGGCLSDLPLYYLTQSPSGQKLWEAVGMYCENQNGTTDLQTHGGKRLHFTQQHQNILFFSSSEHGILSMFIFQVIKQILINLQGLKSYKVSFPITVE